VSGFFPRLVASKHPGSRRSARCLFQDVITQVKDVDPVIKLAFSIGPGLDAPELVEELCLGGALQLLYQASAVRRNLTGGLFEFCPIYLHGCFFSPLQLNVFPPLLTRN
jgi:hypothetical protein